MTSDGLTEIPEFLLDRTAEQRLSAKSRSTVVFVLLLNAFVVSAGKSVIVRGRKREFF